MKHNLVTIFALSLALLVAPVHAAKIEGVEIPETFSVDSNELMLNGVGVRSKFFIDLYVGSLYLKTKSENGNQIVDADEPMSIRLHIISSMITSDKMVAATKEGFENATGNNTQPIQSQIDSFIEIFKEQINENDIFDISYQPGKGIIISKNGELKDSIDGGMEFKKAVFGIWLSDSPAQESLKKEMLGK